VGLFVNAEKWKTAKEFIAEARTRAVSGGISGIGSVSQLAGLSLAGEAGLKPVNWVPFKGGAESVTNLAGNHIDFCVTTTSSAKSLVDAGKLRLLLVFSDEKDPMFPNAPISKEAGLDLAALPVVRGALAPPGVSPQIAGILREAFAGAVKEPEFVAWAKKSRVEIQPMGHEKFLKYTLGVEKVIMQYLKEIQIKK
jgi:tripartite-type tricarboxylate transporter receptor subunit TctC